jgi:hypothetical protein
MSFIKKLLDKSGLAILFQPRIDDEEERQKSIDWINQSLAATVRSVLDDIETEKLGFYPHPENQQALNLTADSLGYIHYLIKDKSDRRLELSQLNLVSCNSIKMTENYRQLKSLIDKAGYNIELKEIAINSEGVETYEDINENMGDFSRYFIIIVSGW